MIEKLFSDQRQWSQDTFGFYADRKEKMGHIGLIRHLREETLEVEYETDPTKVPEELADLTIILMELWMLYGLDCGDMLACVAAKQVKNRQRKWPSRKDQDPSQPINHDK